MTSSLLNSSLYLILFWCAVLQAKNFKWCRTP